MSSTAHPCVHLEFGLGPVPADEESIATRPHNSVQTTQAMLAQAQIYCDQLRRTFPIPEDVNASLLVRTFPHEFGRYCEVVVQTHDESPASAAYALHVEANSPLNWDRLALAQIADTPGIAQAMLPAKAMATASAATAAGAHQGRPA